MIWLLSKVPSTYHILQQLKLSPGADITFYKKDGKRR
jgi:hypothetical protein